MNRGNGCKNCLVVTTGEISPEECIGCKGERPANYDYYPRLYNYDGTKRKKSLTPTGDGGKEKESKRESRIIRWWHCLVCFFLDHNWKSMSRPLFRCCSEDSNYWKCRRCGMERNGQYFIPRSKRRFTSCERSPAEGGWNKGGWG